MLRKSKYTMCAAALGLAGIWGAFSLAKACDRPATCNYAKNAPVNIGEIDQRDAFEADAAEQAPPGPVLTKVRNDKTKIRNDKAGKSTSRKSSTQTVLAKRAQAVLTAKCARCHGGNRQESGLDLRSRQAILKGGDSGPGLIPGKPDESLILQRVRDGEMPPRNAGQLSPQEIATLQQWIKAGAP